jgi:NTE family protein
MMIRDAKILTNATAHAIESLLLQVSMLVFLLLTGCGSLATASNNYPLGAEEFDSGRMRYRDLPKVEIDERQVPEAFIGIAFSGGGSRAANFALGVSHALRELGVFERSDVISSVSGGSLPAAYLALNWGEKFNPEEADSKMRQDFLGNWLLNSINPLEMFRTTLMSDKNSSNTLTDTFDRLLFSGATFDNISIPPEKHGPPRLLINAAIASRTSVERPDLYSSGFDILPLAHNGFAFTNKAFAELKTSRKDFPISMAVAASGAFPAIFGAVSIRDNKLDPYRSSINGLPIDGVEVGYLHLVDGGIVDNLGVNALLQSFVNAKSLPAGKKTCLLIVVDAHVSDVLDRRAALSDLRTNPYDYIVAPTVSTTFDALLQQLRHRQLQRFGIDLTSINAPTYIKNAQIKLGQNSYRANEYLSITGRPDQINDEIANNNKLPLKDAVTCDVWHISLDRLLELTEDGGYVKRETTTYPNQINRKASDKDKYLERLADFVSSIDTNYRLTVSESDKSCASELIQDSLFAAGYQLVYRDLVALNGLKSWLDINKFTGNRSKYPSGIDSRLFNANERFEKSTTKMLSPAWYNKKSASITCQ